MECSRLPSPGGCFQAPGRMSCPLPTWVWGCSTSYSDSLIYVVERQSVERGRDRFPPSSPGLGGAASGAKSPTGSPTWWQGLRAAGVTSVGLTQCPTALPRTLPFSEASWRTLCFTVWRAALRAASALSGAGLASRAGTSWQEWCWGGAGRGHLTPRSSCASAPPPQIREIYKQRLGEIQMLEQHVIQARARALAETERAVNQAKVQAHEVPVRLPPVKTMFRWCIDSELLRERHLICPEDYYDQAVPFCSAPKGIILPGYSRPTFSFEMRSVPKRSLTRKLNVLCRQLLAVPEEELDHTVDSETWDSTSKARQRTRDAVKVGSGAPVLPGCGPWGRAGFCALAVAVMQEVRVSTLSGSSPRAQSP
uniref:Uncharacterized protein n=1 Tax=Oryctolagus cuniculus TaxID=9986 RepID=A0A5F9CDA7_RABIT